MAKVPEDPSVYRKRKGWFNEPARHRLARLGIRTKEAKEKVLAAEARLINKVGSTRHEIERALHPGTMEDVQPGELIIVGEHMSLAHNPAFAEAVVPPSRLPAYFRAAGFGQVAVVSMERPDGEREHMLAGRKGGAWLLFSLTEAQRDRLNRRHKDEKDLAKVGRRDRPGNRQGCCRRCGGVGGDDQRGWCGDLNRHNRPHNHGQLGLGLDPHRRGLPDLDGLLTHHQRRDLHGSVHDGFLPGRDG